MVLGFVKGYIEYTCNYFIMFKKKSLAKLCLRALNDIFNVLPPNICQCLHWTLRDALICSPYILHKCSSCTNFPPHFWIFVLQNKNKRILYVRHLASKTGLEKLCTAKG